MSICRKFLAGLVLCFLLVPLASAEPDDGPFDFVVIGCMPYFFPADHTRFLRLIDEVNQLEPAFTVHCGDTKSGSTPCDDETFDRIRDYFNAFNHPLAYSVGDNEWTDCYRENCGAYDPLERLAYIRQHFFAQEQTLGARPMPVESQRHHPDFGLYVENTRWERGGVSFVAVHVVGTNNNNRPGEPEAIAEYEARDTANEAWIRESFALALENEHRAVALFIQANPFDARGAPRSDGFERFLRVLREETIDFPGEVVLFHSDSHYFRIDKPMLYPGSRRSLENFTRVETFGSENMHAVRVTVDPEDEAALFTFRAHLIPQE